MREALLWLWRLHNQVNRHSLGFDSDKRPPRPFNVGRAVVYPFAPGWKLRTLKSRLSIAFGDSQVYVVGRAGVHNGNSGQNRRSKRGFLELFLIVRRHPWIQCLCLCSAALMLSCSYASDTRNEKPPVDRLLEPVPHDRYADDVGRFLAGLPARSDSPLASFQDNTAWAKHRHELDSAWTKTGE